MGQGGHSHPQKEPLPCLGRGQALYGVPVPVVDETRCYGCGFCEHHCPKPVSAIVVEARGALCLAEGLDFEKDARRRGLRLDATKLPLTMRQCRIWTGLGRLLLSRIGGLRNPAQAGLSLRPQIGSSREGETFCLGTVIWRPRGRSRGPREPWAWASPVCQPARSGNKSQNEHVRKFQKIPKNFLFHVFNMLPWYLKRDCQAAILISN